MLKVVRFRAKGENSVLLDGSYQMGFGAPNEEERENKVHFGEGLMSAL